jgi:hypothetical protein
MKSEEIFVFFIQVLFSGLFHHFFWLWLVNNKKHSVFSVISDCIGKCQTKGRSITSVNVAGLSRNPLYTPIVLLNKYVFSVQTSARYSCQSLAINLAISPETTQIKTLRNKKYCPGTEASCSNGGHGVAQQEKTVNSGLRGSDGEVRRTSGSSIAYSFGAPQVAASLTASGHLR